MTVSGLWAGFRPPSEIFEHSKDYASYSSYSDSGGRSVFISVFLYLGKTFHSAEIRTSSPVKENPNENESQRKYSAITPVPGHYASTRPSRQYSAITPVFGPFLSRVRTLGEESLFDPLYGYSDIQVSC